MNFFDTSALIAAFWGDHPNHAISVRLFGRATRADSMCAAHSLAEVYAVTTRLPVKPAIRPEQAMLFVQETIARLMIVPLEEPDYIAVLQEATERGVGGGRIYDALIAQCARKAGARTIYTWNVRDFERVAPDLADRIKTPDQTG